MSKLSFKRFPSALATCIFVALLCANSRAALIAHYDLNFNQELRPFEVLPNQVRFAWNLYGLAPDMISVPVGWDEERGALGYRLGDVVNLPVNAPGDKLTVQWSCANCYLNYSVFNPPTFAIPSGFSITSGTAKITSLGNYVTPAMWGLAVDLYGVASVPEPSGMFVLLVPALLFARTRRAK